MMTNPHENEDKGWKMAGSNTPCLENVREFFKPVLNMSLDDSLVGEFSSSIDVNGAEILLLTKCRWKENKLIHILSKCLILKIYLI